jgi:uncharacterized protein YbjT (DUF2867 family)
MGEKTFVTGATGNVGKPLIEKLKEKGADLVAGISSKHDPAEFEVRGIPAVSYDLKEPAGMAAAFAGIDRLFALVPFTPFMEENSADMLKAAQEAGVKYILRLSVIGADPASEYALMKVHGDIDQALIDSGIPYTIIRPNSFMQNFVLYYGSFIKNEGTVYLAQGDGKSSYVDAKDVADVAAEILMRPEAHANRIYDITGGRSITNQEAAEIISATLGKTVTYVPIDEMMAQMGMMQMNLPDWTIEKMLSLHKFIKDGHTAPVSNTVIEIAGHDPITFEQFAEANAEAWK